MADHTLDDILADTTAETTADASIVTLLDGLQTQLTQALSGQTISPAAQAKVNAIFANMKTNDAAIAAAIAANTPISTTPPATGGTAVTTTTIASSMNPATVGAPVTLSAVVTQTSPASPVVVPTGTVQFQDAGVSVGSGTLDATGTATMAVSTLAAGDHPITAVYSGDGANAGSTSGALTETIGAAASPATGNVTPAPVATPATTVVTPVTALGSVPNPFTAPPVAAKPTP